MFTNAFAAVLGLVLLFGVGGHDDVATANAPRITVATADYASMRDPADCTAIFEVGLDDKWYWHGCPTSSCQPNFGDCAKATDDIGRRYCKCREPGAPPPLCSAHAYVNPTTGLIGSWECLTHGCPVQCQPVANDPYSTFWPCTC